MNLTNRIVWFNFGGTWLHGRVTRDDPQSQFVPVIVEDDGPAMYTQIVHKGNLYFTAPPQEVQP